MEQPSNNQGDSVRIRDMSSRDADTAGPWAFLGNKKADIPILLAVPHAGRAYSDRLLAQLRDRGTVMRLEDRLVDRVADVVAQRTGASILMANAPRAMIDLNRAPDDVDWSMIDRTEGHTPRSKTGAQSRRVRSGLGLVPRRLPGVGELWRSRISGEELQRRIDQIHAPYHAALDQELRRLASRWGAALLIDVHSMPPLSQGEEGEEPLHFVLGDRFGASCAGSIGAAVFNQLGGDGWRIAHNRPYAGGYVLDRHGRPRRGIHALQLEICRSVYLDETLVELGSGFERVTDSLTALVRKLSVEVAALGRGSLDAMAAE